MSSSSAAETQLGTRRQGRRECRHYAAIRSLPANQALPLPRLLAAW